MQTINKESFKIALMVSILICLASGINFFVLDIKLGDAQSSSTFETRKQDWLDQDGRHWDESIWDDPHYGMTHVFAWLENGIHQYCSFNPDDFDCVHEVIHELFEKVYMSGSTASNSLMRLLCQYKDQIKNGPYPQDWDDINNYYYKAIQQPWLLGGSGKITQPQQSVARYLVSQEYRHINFQYCPNGEDGQSCFNFSYYNPRTGATNSYVVGNFYNSYQLARDYLYHTFDHWVNMGSYEFDSKNSYTEIGIQSLLLLYDFADRSLESLGGHVDPEGIEMRKRAKMILDLYLYDSIIDALPDGQKGSNPGRSYRDKIVNGKDGFPWYHYWGFGVDGGPQTNVMYVSSYRLSPLLEDIGDLSDEDNNYWLEGYENNYSWWLAKEGGKTIYATKTFNLGSGLGKRWILNIKSDDWGGSFFGQGRPFSVWINNHPGDADVDACQVHLCYNELGTSGCHYKNSLITPVTDPILHVAKRNFEFDYGENNLIPMHSINCNGNPCQNDYVLSYGWNYFREGDTALAVNMSENWSVIEVGILDPNCSAYHCFDDFDAFRSAARTFYNSNQFTNSHGDTIGCRQDPNLLPGPQTAYVTTLNGQDVYSFPFERLRANQGNHSQQHRLIDWNANIMTVNENNLTCQYNFDNWTYQGNACRSRVHLSLLKLSDKSQVSTGDTITYTIQYANSSPLTARDVTILDTIPNRTTYVPGTISPGGYQLGNQLIWDLGDIPAGQQGDLTFQVRVD